MTQFVTNDVIATDAINATSIAANAVNTAEIAANAVTTTKIADANVTPAKLSQPLTLATVQTTVAGTEKDFAIPSWARRIRVLLNGVSYSGTLQPRIRVIGASVVTSGYVGAGTVNGTTANLSDGFDVYLNAGASAADTYHGALDLTLLDPATFTWIAHGVFSTSNVTRIHATAGRITLAQALTAVRLTSTGAGTDTFDLGSVNVIYD